VVVHDALRCKVALQEASRKHLVRVGVSARCGDVQLAEEAGRAGGVEEGAARDGACLFGAGAVGCRRLAL
jgi:hypothetical protein